MLEKICIADDDDGIRFFAAEALEGFSNKYEICVFKDGSELDKYLKEHGDYVRIIVTDNDMPGMKGIDVARKYKDEKKDFFLMSGKVINKDELQEAGVKEFFYKPFDVDVLVETVGKYLKKLSQ
jgi:DNA-binding NtrC family response regulator